jgi:hypothetical protein
MVLHAIDIEQPLLLGQFARSTFHAAKGLYTGRRINRVACLESNERRVAREEE